MHVICLDLEGVLVPEIWIAFADAAGVPELRITTREEPDYDKLMKFRLNLLKKRELGLREIQKTIATIAPLFGAKEFLDKLRSKTQVMIISDTFTQSAQPLMEKLGWPTILCNELVVKDDGEIVDYRLRVTRSKYTAVKALQSAGLETVAAGDSYNDPEMSVPARQDFCSAARRKSRKTILKFGLMRTMTNSIMLLWKQWPKKCSLFSVSMI